MSVIEFDCHGPEKNDVKNGVWKIIQDHYFQTVFPNSKVRYEDEGKEVYLDRLSGLMKNSLCKAYDKDGGVAIEFDFTEDAGFQITSEVYHTSMGYNDNGLSEVVPVFEKIIELFPGVTFESDIEIDDGENYKQQHYYYDGQELTCNGLNYKIIDQLYEMMAEGVDMDDMAEKLGISFDDLEAFLSEEAGF